MRSVSNDARSLKYIFENASLKQQVLKTQNAYRGLDEERFSAIR